MRPAGGGPEGAFGGGGARADREGLAALPVFRTGAQDRGLLQAYLQRVTGLSRRAFDLLGLKPNSAPSLASPSEAGPPLAPAIA